MDLELNDSFDADLYFIHINYDCTMYVKISKMYILIIKN